LAGKNGLGVWQVTHRIKSALLRHKYYAEENVGTPLVLEALAIKKLRRHGGAVFPNDHRYLDSSNKPLL
jgi:hypothetical protein